MGIYGYLYQVIAPYQFIDIFIFLTGVFILLKMRAAPFILIIIQICLRYLNKTTSKNFILLIILFTKNDSLNFIFFCSIPTIEFSIKGNPWEYYKYKLGKDIYSDPWKCR